MKPATPNTSDYVFTHDGVKYTLPSMAMIKAGVIRRIRNIDDEAEAFFALLEGVASAESLAALDDMPMMRLNEVIQGWQDHAGVRLGE